MAIFDHCTWKSCKIDRAPYNVANRCKPHLLGTAKIINSTYSLHINYQLLVRDTNMYVNAIYVHVASQPLAVRLIEHRLVFGQASSSAQTSIGWCVKIFSKAPVLGTVRCSDGRRWIRTIYILNAVLAPDSAQRINAFFSANDLTKRRTGTVVPKLQGAVDFKKYLNFTWHRTISKMFFRTILPVASRAPYGRRRIVRCFGKKRLRTVPVDLWP